MRRSPLVLLCFALACGKSDRDHFDRGTLEGQGGAAAGAGGTAAGVAGNDPETGGTGDGGNAVGEAGRPDIAGSAGEAGAEPSAGGFSAVGGASAVGGSNSAGGGVGGGDADSGAPSDIGAGGAPPDDPRYDDFVVRSRAMAAYEGLRVFVRYRQARGFQEVRSDVVTGGVFEVGWRQGFDRETFGAVVTLFVDQGSDGECTLNVDQAWSTQAQNLAPRGEPEILEFDPEAGGLTRAVACVDFAND